MISYYVVLEDMNYNNNQIRFISLSEEIAFKWCLANTTSKQLQFSLMRYDMMDEGVQTETEIKIPYPSFL